MNWRYFDEEESYTNRIGCMSCDREHMQANAVHPVPRTAYLFADKYSSSASILRSVSLG